VTDILLNTDLYDSGLAILERALFVANGNYAEALLNPSSQTWITRFAITSFALSAITNVVSTVMIAYKAWYV
jgi:hypothetical protein